MGMFKAVLVGILAVAAYGSAVVLLDDSHASVIRVIDGDTIVADIRGQATTVRLLNIDTPETKDPNEPVECLGPEATEYLRSRLQAGDEITLEYDVERRDRYGRTLAGVFESGTLVNADIAAEGLGVAVLYEPNRKYYDQVLRAQESARSRGVGFYDTDVKCTLPAQVAEAVLQLEGISSEVPANSGDAVAAIASVDARLAVAYTMASVVKGLDDGVDVFHAAYRADRATHASRLSSAVAEAQSVRSWLQSERQRLEEEERRAAEEAARKAKEEKARRAAKEAAERAAAEREAAAARESQRTSTKTSSSSSSGSSNPYPGYTGPRCYAPGGKTWKPCP